LTENDAGFRQFGRPEQQTRAEIDTELLDIVLYAENRIHAAKTYLYGGDVKSAREQMIRVSRANVRFSNAIIRRMLQDEGT
jgi:hypothetical protein